MSIKNIEKASKICKQIKKIDFEIKEIEKMALLVANGEAKSSFKLVVDDVNSRIASQNKVSFDEYGDIIQKNNSKKSNPHSHIFGILSGRDMGLSFEKKEKPKDQFIHVLKQNVSDTTLLNILGLLIADKKECRAKLMESISKLGFKF